MSQKHPDEFYREVVLALYWGSVAIVLIIGSLTLTTSPLNGLALTLCGGYITALILRCLFEIE